MAEVKVENIIVSMTISPSLDLPKLAEILPDAIYKPEEVPVIILKLPKPRSMITLFSNGNAVITGPKSMDEVHAVIKMVKDRLDVVGVQVEKEPELKIQNISVSTDLKQSLNLKRLAKSLETAEYTPKVFPGLIYKGEDPNTVILLFNSGKIICNGVNLDEVTVALDKILEKLLSFGIKKEEKECQK